MRAAPDLSAPPIRITDGVLTAICARLAAPAPERGGALMAIGGLLHLVVEDNCGRYTRTSWDISAELSTAVGRLEESGHGTFAGTVHTHPSTLPDPSSTDIATTREALRRNAHLDGLLIAVVTAGTPREHDLRLGVQHRMSLHLVPRPGEERAVVARMRGEVVPLATDLAAAGISLTSDTSVRSWLRARSARHSRVWAAMPTAVSLNHSPRLAVRVPSSRPAALFIHPDYPQTGPIAVTAQQAENDTSTLRPLPSAWDPVSAPAPQLTALARSAAGRRIRRSTTRVWPLVGSLAGKKVLVAGAGSVGSYIAENLVRSGVGILTIIDPDQVDPSNLARTTYTAADIGLPKPEALARHLRMIDPAVIADGRASTLGATDLNEALNGVSLVIAATDDMADQAVLAHHAYTAGIPLVACALYKAAAAGEVVLSVPAAGTACWSCAVGAGTAADSYRPPGDYGLGGRLAGEVALGPSIHLVASVAVSAALGLLAGQRRPAHAAVRRLLAEQRTVGVIATAPRWQFFPKVFAGMDHQHAPQSIWIRVDRATTCTVCGSHPTAPLDAQAGADIIKIISRHRGPQPAPP